MNKIIIISLLILVGISFADNSYNEGNCTPKIVKSKMETTKKVNDFLAKQDIDKDKTINPFDTQCLVALSDFLHEIKLSKNIRFKFEPKNYKSVVCIKNSKKTDTTKLDFIPISVICNKQKDVIQTGYNSFTVIYNANKNQANECKVNKNIPNDIICSLSGAPKIDYD